MADRWKASVCTIAGEPVAIIDVEIKRTMFIDPSLFEGLSSTGNENGLAAAGLSAAKEFIQEIQDVPEDTRRFFVEPFAEVENGRINMQPFASIMQLFDERNYVRLVGDAASGFTGVFYIAGLEKQIDFSEANLPAVEAQLQRERSKAQEAAARGEITQEQADAVDFFCDAIDEKRRACGPLYEALARAKAIKDQQDREQEIKDLEAREHQAKDKASERGGRLSDSFSGLK